MTFAVVAFAVLSVFVFVDLRSRSSSLCGREFFFAVYEGYLGFTVLVLIWAPLLAVLLSYLEFSWALIAQLKKLSWIESEGNRTQLERL